MDYTVDYLKIKEVINEAQCVVVGIGSGMSASAGLDYTSEEVFKSLYPKYYDLGYKSIFQCLGDHWVSSINKNNEKEYWNFWKLHINNIRFKPNLTKPYKLLSDLLKDKKHFVITTNADGQTQKAFNKVYAPQGDYSLLQCKNNCNNKIYNVKDYLDKDIIPKCSNCNDYLIPNLRCDEYFCETKASDYYKDYYNFIVENKDKKVVLIEIGVGFNTPGIIRFPFDQLSSLNNITLIRINKSDCRVSDGNFGIKENVLEVLDKLF